MKLIQYYESDDPCKPGFVKVEHEGQCLGTFDDPLSYTQALCFVQGYRTALGLPSGIDYLYSLQVDEVSTALSDPI